MNQHTLRILHRMSSLLRTYQAGELGLRYLVSELEASLNALEERLPEAFYHNWYVHWGRLEEILALGMDNEHCDEVLENVRALESLLNQAETA